MPYRRLPNTDNARIRSLKTAIEKMSASRDANIIKFDVISLETMLRNFENAQLMYKQSLEKQAAENRKLQKLVKNARLYVSHFIQVLNLCIARGEIKKDVRSFYNLEVDSQAVPDLATNEALLTWGEDIIKGENLRIQNGGAPIYNPTIARVNVAYSQFKDGYFTQRTFQSTTARHLETLSQQREDIDKALCSLWNQIEAFFADLEPEEKLERCKDFGIIYYLRRSEKEPQEGEEEVPDDIPREKPKPGNIQLNFMYDDD